MATKNKNDKRSPPSRLRYEAANPTVSARVSQEIKEELDELRLMSGLSVADILNAGLDRLKPDTEASYERGLKGGCEMAEEEFKVLATCSGCGRTHLPVVGARGGAARTFPIAIHRPVVTLVEGFEPELHSWVKDPWEELGQRLIVYVDPPPPPPPAEPEPLVHELVLAEPELTREPEPEIDWAALAAERKRVLEDIEEQLGEAAGALRTARFRFALIGLADARLALGDLEPGDDLQPLRARLETLAATAHVALGKQQNALESLLRALEADPDLTLDPATTSPKVLLALRLARATERRRAGAQ